MNLKSARNVLGINNRNLGYIFPYNPRTDFEKVDDKLVSKEIMEEAGLPVPDTYKIFEERDQTDQIQSAIELHGEFAIKPAGSYGGQGVKIVKTDSEGTPVNSGKEPYRIDELEFHIIQILSGTYSLDNTPDRAFLEYLIREPDPVARMHDHTGVSDLRVIVFLNQPVMAMWRLPSTISAGRANLHAGGVGVGIDMEQGRTTTAITNTGTIEEHPDSELSLSDFDLPHWEQILDACRGINDVFGLNYLGIDFVFDRDLGPLIIEANARPGLAIQNANQKGLRSLLEQIERDQS